MLNVKVVCANTLELNKNKTSNAASGDTVVKKTDYFSKHVNGLIKNFFNDSASQFASFFTTATNLSEKELENLKTIIDLEIQKKKK